jgi:hypothetical protein
VLATLTPRAEGALAHEDDDVRCTQCSATVRDSCDQSMTTEKNAMSADQAMASGGVGDRMSSGTATPTASKPMTHRKRHMTMHHKTMTTTTETTEPTPK